MNGQRLSNLARELKPYFLSSVGLTAETAGVIEVTDMLVHAGFYVKGPRPWADVMAHGAVGDGSTDDTPAFTKAYDELPATGGIILMPGAGPFKITGLTFNKPIVLMGSGGNLSSSGTTAITTLLYEGTGTAISLTNGARGSQLLNFRLSDKDNTGDIGILVNTDDVKIEKVFIWDTTTAIAADFEGWATAAIYVGSTQQCNDLLLRDIYVRAILGTGFLLEHVSEATIDHCRLIQCYDNGILLGAGGNSTSNIVICNGTAVATANRSGSRGINLSKALYKTIIRDCYFESDGNNGANYAIDSDSATQVDLVEISSCYFTGSEFGPSGPFTSPDGTTAAYAIRANRSGQVLLVTGANYFRNFTTAAILATAAARIGIRGEFYFDGVGTTANQPRAISSYNIVRYAGTSEEITLPDTGNATDKCVLGTAVLGRLVVTNRSDGVVGIFNCKGGGNSTSLIAGDTGWFAGGTSTTASRLCCWWDGTNYVLENNLGSSKVVTFALES